MVWPCRGSPLCFRIYSWTSNIKRLIQSKLNTRVLLLNQNYEPLTVCTARRAILLVFRGKAEVVEKFFDEAVIEELTPLYAIPEGYALVPIKESLQDGGYAQKAFWHALEFCNNPEDRNIRSHWENYKELIKSKEDLT